MLKKSTCAECSNRFESRQYNASFCGDKCKRTFNNRRAQRGAVLYDLAMIEALDPQAHATHKLADRAQDLVQTWCDEDAKAGRKRTWKRAHEVKYDTAAMVR